MSLSCGCYKKETSKHSQANKRQNRWIKKDGYYIGITRSGAEFMIDEDDYDSVSKLCWHKGNDGYIATNFKTGTNVEYVLLHRYILKINHLNDNDEEIDHINGLRYDDRKLNLRIVSHCQNMQNAKISKANTSGHKGVSFSNKEGKWKAYITANHKIVRLGTFDTYEEAVVARENAEKKYHGDFSRAAEYIHNGCI
mgnify:FL=1